MKKSFKMFHDEIMNLNVHNKIIKAMQQNVHRFK